MKLFEEKCRPVEKGQSPIGPDEIRELSREVPQWTIGDTSMEREFKFKDFNQAMAFVNKVAEAASGEDHHPDILISYNKVKLILSTHRIGGLSRNDFIMAAKVDRITLPQPA
ncbi:MAG: 4a-hydroxytetrahydrobiopterin dehydratase [Deltaproteobacteria bacterium]|nr:4a-hydroxytetrahydrobiopterin dehydratase [Deltaproteobacteria bacterium]